MSGQKKDAFDNLNTQENIRKDSNRYFPENVWKILDLFLYSFDRVKFSIDTIQDKHVKNPRLLT